MANPLLAIVSGDDEAEDKGNAKKKTAVAKDLLKAVKGDDPDGAVKAVETLMKLCELDKE